VEKDKFLSTVNDIDADISIRFDFTVVGADSLRICQAVCTCDAASRLEAGAMSPQRSTRLRCHCEVSHPDVGAPDDPVVARLGFNAVQFYQEIPTCNTRQEALSSAIVYCLDIARKDATGEPAFAEQLEALKDSIRTMRERSRSNLRPVKALLLYSSDNVRPTSSLEVWALQLADFEQELGDMWKFGPMMLQDADGMHGIFQEITFVRTSRIASKKDFEAEDQDAEQVYTSGEAQQVAFLVQTSPHRTASVSSSVSAGQLPPQYKAEMSGSECSETALELQRRLAEQSEHVMDHFG